jgi:hypothetical protein
LCRCGSNQNTIGYEVAAVEKQLYNSGDLVMFWWRGSHAEEPKVGIVIDVFRREDPRYGDEITVFSGDLKYSVPEVWCARC